MSIVVLGLDIAKTVFQVHGVDASGQVGLRRRLSRHELVAFLAKLPPCLVGMEACSNAHHWAREFVLLGHTVRLIPPQYVKPYVKRNKTDAADAEAICEAVARPNMRFVPIKTVEQQGILALHRVRSLLVRQRTAAVNAIRGLMAEFGVVAGKGTRRISTIRAASERTRAGRLPGSARRAAWAWYVDGAIGSTLQIGLILSLSKDDPVNSTVTRSGMQLFSNRFAHAGLAAGCAIPVS